MKKLSSYISTLQAKSSIVAGLIVFLLFSQQIHYQQEQIKVKVEVSSSEDGENDDSEHATMISVDQDIIASGIQFNVNHVFYEIMNIEQDEEDDTFESAEIKSVPNDFHKILFRQVISPNAP